MLQMLLKEIAETGTLTGISTHAEPGKQVVLRENDSKKQAVIGAWNGERMEPVMDGFLGLGISALKRAGASDSRWCLIDELGFLESGCLAFQDTVFELLGKKRVIAVLRKQDLPFLNTLRSRSDVFLYDLDAPVLPVGCVIMASGLGRRFGGNKLLADFAGRPLIRQILDLTEGPFFAGRVVVTRHEAVADLCKSCGVSVLVHDFPDRNDTVRLGLEALRNQEIRGCMFCPADQPLIARQTLESLVLSFSHEPDRIFRPCFGETPGSPVLFGQNFFQELLGLPSGKGGSFLAKKYPGQVQKIPVREPYELWDADTPEELQRFETLKRFCVLREQNI